MGMLRRRVVLSMSMAAPLLAGCGGSQPPIAPAAMPESHTMATHADQSGSWMLPATKGEDLLYVTKLRAVNVYEYHKPSRLVGYLPVSAENACSDNRGNVWLLEGGSDFGASYVVEYAHGGKNPIAKLDDTDGYPSGCAVDPITGNLAVANECANYTSSVCNGMGNVDIYTDAKGHATRYASPDIYYYYYCDYDASGNLLVNGTISSGYPRFAELRRGHNSFTDITAQQAFQRVGGVQWDGIHVAIADPIAGNIYEFSLNQQHLRKVTTTPIEAGFDGSFVVRGNQVVVSGSDSVAWYNYPVGGLPTRKMRVAYSHSVALSVAPSGARTRSYRRMK